jgi:hypothetical protein
VSAAQPGRRALGIAVRLGGKTLAWKIALALAALGFGLLFIVGLFVASAPGSDSGAGQCDVVSSGAKGVPANYVPWLEKAAARYELRARGLSIIAAVHQIESDFGRSTLPGVRSGTNSAGAAGPGQFLAATWEAYGVDADGDGRRDIYSVPDSIFATANYLHASGAPRDWAAAIFSYNHAWWYVDEVEAKARQIGDAEVLCESPSTSAGGEAQLDRVETLRSPLAFKPLPSRLWVGGGSPESLDARVWPDAVWFLEAFELRVSAAREAGHNTHGDGTALDLVPAAGRGWESTARRAAQALGWRESCGGSGTAPVCPLAPAIQFVGYNGYPGHGDPAHAGGNAHLHVSWKSASFGSCSALCQPAAWVQVFPLGP